MTLTKLTGMEILASFSETDAAKLRVGQPATVTVDALPNEQLAAHVIAVASTATTSSNVVTYDVTFALDRTNAQLKPGMTANVDVVTADFWGGVRRQLELRLRDADEAHRHADPRELQRDRRREAARRPAGAP